MADTAGDVERSSAQRLFVVSGTFTIFGRGIVLLPGVPKYEPGPRIAAGVSIELRRPNGTILLTTIRGIEWFQTPPQPSNTAADAARDRQGGSAGGDRGLVGPRLLSPVARRVSGEL